MLSTIGDGPADLHAVRETNLSAVLRAVRHRAPCSRADIAAVTRLNKATVSSIVTDLISMGVVRELGSTTERRVGRPAVMLTLDDRGIAAVGLEVNVDYLALVAVNLNEEEILRRHEPLDAVNAGPETCAARLADLTRRALEDPSLHRRSVLGVTVAVPGLIDAPGGVVANAPNLRWRGFPLRERVSSLLEEAGLEGIPVFVDNDANLSAVAEYRSGHLAHTRDLVYVTGEVGLGAGIIAGGTLLRGGGYSGEIGHIPLTAEGPRCGCGRIGCLEALAGISTILCQAVPDLVGERAPGPEAGGELSTAVAATADRATAGDTATCRALAQAGTWLGRGIATVANLLNPRAVVLGGYFVPLAPWLLPACSAALSEHALAPEEAGCAVEVSTLGLTAAARGGATALVDALDRGHLPLPTRKRVR